MENLRDLCIRKDFKASRDIRRIPIITDLIYNLWKQYRTNDDSIGFFYITNFLEVKASEKEKDSFFWEEDEWYDFISNEIKNTKGFIKKYEKYS